MASNKKGCAAAEKAGTRIPIIDRNRCEGKADCVRVCPYSVFEIHVLPKAERSKLSLRGRLKAWAHGGKQAFIARADSCRACGLCVESCPESALSLPALSDTPGVSS